MALLAQFILFILCLLMFVVDRRYKFAILILSTICFSFVTLPYIPFGSGKYVLSNCFIVSELPFIFRLIRNIRRSVIWEVLVIVLFSIIIQIVTSPHYNDSLTNMIRIFIMEFIAKYLALGYAFVCVASEKDLRPTIKISFYGLIVLTLFGIINYITGVAEIVNELGIISHDEIGAQRGEMYTYSERFRVQALFRNPFDYGYICIVMAILHYWGYMRGMLSKPNLYTSFACCLFGIFTCGSRTVIVCAFLAFSSYLLFGTEMKKRFQYSLLICIIGAISYSSIPYVKDKVDSTLTAFDTDSSYGGSSIEMRRLQYATVLEYVDGYEWFGRGKDFFNIDLGWSERFEGGLVERDLLGLEGVFMGLLLESGIIGAIFYLLIYGILFYYSFRYRKVDKQSAALCISMLVAYFSFANMTGELQSVFPTLLVAGSFLSILYNKDRYIRIMNSQDKVKANSKA